MRQTGFRSLVHEVDGVAVHAVASSEPAAATAPVIVLVHGLALSHRYMMPLARALATGGCRVYVPDLPGFGDSGHPAQVLDVRGLAAALADWMDAADIPQATLVGNSFGCQIIAELAAKWPRRVERAVLQGPTAPPGERDTVHQFVRWRQNDRYNPPDLGPMAADDYRRAGYGPAWRTFRHSLRDHVEDKAPRMRTPVLYIRGQHDPICPAHWLMDLARRSADAYVVEIPGVAHTLCYTAPVAVAGLTRAFLGERAAPGAGMTRQRIPPEPARWDPPR